MKGVGCNRILGLRAGRCPPWVPLVSPKTLLLLSSSAATGLALRAGSDFVSKRMAWALHVSPHVV